MCCGGADRKKVMNRLTFREPLALALLLALAAPALAQVAAPRTLAELKTEVQGRADRHAYPVSELEPAEVREALAALKTLDRAESAQAWSAPADRHMAQSKKPSYLPPPPAHS